MAEVTGSIGDENVVLNNAATEATLRQLLGAIGVLASKSGAGYKSQKDFENDIKRFSAATKEAAASGKKFTSASKEAYLAEKEAAATVKKFGKNTEQAAVQAEMFEAGLSKAIGSLKGLISYASSTANAIQGMGDSLTSATDTLGQIPLGVGDVISGVFGPVAGAVEDAHKAFLEVGSVGANFGGNMNVVMNQAAAAGLTLDQYSGIVKNNSEALMMMGGSVEEGAKRIAQLGKDIRGSAIGQELNRLGYSAVQINEGFADYSKMLAKNGRLQGMTDKQLRDGTASYLKDLDAVAKLTGKSRESLQAEEDARQADAQYRIMMSKLDADGQKNMEALMKSIPAQHQAGLKEILATGTATTEAGMQALAYLEKSGQSAVALHKSMESTGTLSQDQVKTFNATYQAEADKLAKSPLMETLGKFDPAANDFVVGVLDVAARTKDLATIYSETETALKKTQEEKAKGGDVLDAADVVDFKQTIAQSAVEFKKELANVDLGPMKEMFTTAMDAAKDLLVPAIDLAAKNIYALAAAVMAGTVALGARGAIQSVKAAKGKLGAAKAADMDKAKVNAKAAGASDKVAAQAAEKAGKAGVKTGLKTAAKVLGPVAAGAMALYDGVQGWNNASELLGKEGEATTGEKASASAGSVVSGLTFGLVDAGDASKGIADFFGAGGKEGEIARLQDSIAKEKERVERSKSGEDEYWGSEASGQADSLKEIQEMEAKLAKLQGEVSMATIKEEAKKNSSPVPGNPNAPKQSTVDEAKKKLENDIITKKDAEKALKEAEEKAKEAAGEVGGSVDGASIQKSPADAQVALNTNIEELVRLTRAQLNIANKQLRTTEGMTGNLMA
jgi:hypothetical protein